MTYVDMLLGRKPPAPVGTMRYIVYRGPICHGILHLSCSGALRLIAAGYQLQPDMIEQHEK